MKDGLDKIVRNCGGQYPDAAYSRKGYQIGPIEIRQCPKTFISHEAVAYIQSYDATQALGVPFVPTMTDLRCDFVDLANIVETERDFIRQDLDQIKRNAK